MRWNHPRTLAWLSLGVVVLGALLVRSPAAEAPKAAPAAEAVNKPGAAWPLFRGSPVQTGVAASELPTQLKVRWKFPAKGDVEATAAVVEGVVYVGAFDSKLYALDLATGKEKWSYDASDQVKAPASVHDGAVYVGSADGVFHCVDAATGKARWTFKTEGEITAGANFAGDVVLVGSADETLYGLAKDGKKLWDFKINGGPVLAAPAVADGRTFVAGCDSLLHVLETATGKEVGAVDLGGQVGATAAVVGDRLYVGTMTNEVLAVDWKQAKVLWKFESPKGRAFASSPAVTDKLVLIGCRDRRLYALDRETGKEVWSFAAGKDVDSSPVVVGGRVFVGANDGKLYVIDLASGKELKQFDLGGLVIASPAVAQGTLVIGTTKGDVYCFE